MQTDPKKDTRPIEHSSPEEAALLREFSPLGEIKERGDSQRDILRELSKETPNFKDLSNLKQERALRKANKILKKQGFPPVTRADMLSEEEWSSLTDLFKETDKNIRMTMAGAHGIITHEHIPDVVSESEPVGRLRKFVLMMTDRLINEVAEVKKMHCDEEGHFLEGTIDPKDLNKSLEIYEKYAGIQNSMISDMTSISEALGNLLNTIRVNREVSGIPETTSNDITNKEEDNVEQKQTDDLG